MNPKVYIWMVALAIFITVLLDLLIDHPSEQSSSFVGYSDSTWQIQDTLFVRYKGKVRGIDLTKFREDED